MPQKILDMQEGIYFLDNENARLTEYKQLKWSELGK